MPAALWPFWFKALLADWEFCPTLHSLTIVGGDSVAGLLLWQEPFSESLILVLVAYYP